MTMRKEEIELIAALAEGTLEDESRARALLNSSAEARTEYEAQRRALEALRAVEPARLTDVERAELRRDVWTAVRSEGAPRREKAPWYYRWSFAAAGLLVFVGLVAVLNQATQGGDDTAELAADVATSTSAASGGIAEPGLTGRSSVQSDDADVEEAAPAAGDGADQPEEDSAAAEALDSPTSEIFSQVTSMVRSGELTGSAGVLDFFSIPEDDEAAAKCLEDVGLADHVILGEVSEAFDKDASPVSYFVVVPSDSEIGPDTSITLIASDTCEIVFVDG